MVEQDLFDIDRPVVETKTNKTKKKYHQLLSQIVYDFAENTSLNGLKYMTGKRVSIVGKLFWISMFILSTILCSGMVYKTYTKWEHDSVIITLKEHLVSVNEVPFPAITICPQAMIRLKYYNFTEAYFNDTTTNMSVAYSDNKFHTISVLCGLVLNDNISSSELQNLYTDINTIFEVSPKLEDVLDMCVWRNSYSCNDAFRPVLTAEGVCFTFNSLAADEIFRKNSVQQPPLYINTSTPQNGWSLYDNYASAYNEKEYPARGRGNGAYEDLFLSLKEVSDRDFLCEGHTQTGYKVYLHHPADLPQASLHYYAAHPERTTSFALKLNILGTSKEIINYSPKDRQCYFPHDRHLQFFQNYTAKNCKLECFANYTLQKCGCVSFYMPRNSSTDICKVNKINCIFKALDDYVDYEGLGDGNGGHCRCLPSCLDIDYDAEIIVTKFDQKEFDKKLKHLNCLESYSARFSEIIDTEIANYHEDAKAYNETQFDIVETTNEINTSDTKNATNESENYTSTPPNCKSSNYDEAATRSDYKLTEIRMYYRHPQFVAMERSEMFGLYQFLADCGGTLGLFLGFSFLTLAEIFYFFTLNLCCNTQKEVLKEKMQESNYTDSS